MTSKIIYRYEFIQKLLMICHMNYELSDADHDQEFIEYFQERVTEKLDSYSADFHA